MLLTFLPSVPLGALKVTTVIVVATALAHQLHHALQYPSHTYLDISTAATITNNNNMPHVPSPSFGACLMVKDDNDLLPEWLAYHYTVLPLRYLIVGVDVNSTQDPTPILQEWSKRTELHFQTLQASEFMHRFPVVVPKDATDGHADEKTRHHHMLVRRQKGFLTECTERMQNEGVRWTAYIDSDEFVVPNRLSQHDETLVVDGQGHASIRRESLRIRGGLLESNDKDDATTVANVLLELQRQGVVEACYTMPRLLVGALENRTCSSDTGSIPATTAKRRKSFNTLRFLQHAPKGDFQYSKFGKVFMDVGRLPSTKTLGEPRNIHRPYRDFCGPGVVHFPDAYFYLNHYIGSWERYSARSDKRRNRAEWEQRAFVDDGSPTCESGVHGWVQRFLAHVGEENANWLLAGTTQEKSENL